MERLERIYPPTRSSQTKSPASEQWDDLLIFADCGPFPAFPRSLATCTVALAAVIGALQLTLMLSISIPSGSRLLSQRRNEFVDIIYTRVTPCTWQLFRTCRTLVVSIRSFV